jgi:tRNA nucleotidyltransferase (CCA-adding enzyme)
MFGKDFAEMIQKTCKEDPDLQDTSNVGVIQANSEQSKHLETATLRVAGTWIDIVNLRSEKYTEHSRVPIIEIGTPEEDAYRRDLTINSMFYNINEGKVEDFTKLGLYDLKSKTARTPMEPLQTLLDDPLRTLRIIRFANRFDLHITPEILEAA